MAEGRQSAPAWAWDVVGLPWEEARLVLTARGLPFEAIVTAPPNRPHGVGELRVVAERPRPGGSLLVLAYREYQRSEP